MSLISNLYKNKATDLHEQVKKLEHELKMLEEGVVSPPPPPFFSAKDVAKEFTTFPATAATGRAIATGAKATASALANPVETGRQVGRAVKETASKATGAVADAINNPGPAAAALAQKAGSAAQTTAMLGGAIALPLGAGMLARTAVDLPMAAAGFEETNPFAGEVPAARNIATDAADWAAMTATSQLIGNVLSGAPLASGVGTATVAGGIAGALVPVVSYGGYKAGEAIGSMKLPEFAGGESIHSNISDVVQAWQESGLKTAGMEKSDYPSTEELAQESKSEREKKERSEAMARQRMRDAQYDPVHRPKY